MDIYIEKCGLHGLGPEKIRLEPEHGILLMHSYYKSVYKDSQELAPLEACRGGSI